MIHLIDLKNIELKERIKACMDKEFKKGLKELKDKCNAFRIDIELSVGDAQDYLSRYIVCLTDWINIELTERMNEEFKKGHKKLRERYNAA